jgi:hypothetical protein
VNRLEQRYRVVLRTLLPASYRKLWEEDMVATFLESMASDDAEAAEYLADYGRPSWSEVASVAALAVRLRLGAANAPLRSGAWGEAVRLVALMGLLVHAAAPPSCSPSSRSSRPRSPRSRSPWTWPGQHRWSSRPGPTSC